ERTMSDTHTVVPHAAPRVPSPSKPPPFLAVAPINRLPVELLVCIFEFVVADEGESPWKLVLVNNRRWRETALGIQSLWARILITSSSHYFTMHDIGGEIGIVWSQGNMQVCSNVDELNEALIRSGTALLDILIYHPRNNEENALAMYRKVLGQPNNGRLQKLYIHGGTTENTGNQMTTYMESSYPALTTIELETSHEWGDVLLPRFLKAASSVRSIRSQIPRDLDLSIFEWSHLQSLHLIRTTDTYPLNRICYKLQRLHTLNGIPNDWPNDLTPATTFNLLTAIKLAVHPSYGPQALHRLSFPSLTRLDLEIMSHPQPIAIPASVWKLPSLTEFSLEARHIPGVSQWLPFVDMPRLQRLHLEIQADHSERFPPSVHYPNVQSLYIVTSSLAESYFIDLLEASPNASVVTLSYRNAVYHKTGSKMLCPNMTAVSIRGGDMGMTGAREPLEALVRRVVEYRVEQLESFTVTWAGKVMFNPDIVEYVQRAS
ncbi:hypothetical protein FRC17_007188, partial [Serendipita sp. 399]